MQFNTFIWVLLRFEIVQHHLSKDIWSILKIAVYIIYIQLDKRNKFLVNELLNFKIRKYYETPYIYEIMKDPRRFVFNVAAFRILYHMAYFQWDFFKACLYCFHKHIIIPKNVIQLRFYWQQC